jgi:hypothetical protein
VLEDADASMLIDAPTDDLWSFRTCKHG